MPQPFPIPPPGFDELTVDERIDYVGALWDGIVANPDQVTFPNWHRQVLEERRADFEATPDVSQEWRTVREQVSAS